MSNPIQHVLLKGGIMENKQYVTYTFGRFIGIFIGAFLVLGMSLFILISVVSIIAKVILGGA